MGIVAPGRCVAVTRSPATITATGRSDPVFGSTITLTDASPRPALGVRLAHDTSLRVLQSHAGWVRTWIVSSPPSAATALDDGTTSKRQGAAA